MPMTRITSMVDLSATLSPRRLLRRLDPALTITVLILVALAILDPGQVLPTLQSTAESLGHTGIFIVLAVTAVAYLKASGSEKLLARAFEGPPIRMIVLAALLGGLSPFCSCEVIPFIAALLAVGAPLAAVMAFWLASPLMDPAMFTITAGTLGIDFAVAKTVSAVSIGVLGGLATLTFARSPVFRDPLKATPASGCGCGPALSPSQTPVWRFWSEAARRTLFRQTWLENVFFLGKWLLLAYVLESLMIRYVPAELISSVVGGPGLAPVVIAALVGMPAYLNGFAAVPLLDGLIDQGMAPGAAMSFAIAGGISCIPAAVAVWSLVKPRVFAAYLGYALVGSIIAGLAFNAIA